MTAEEPDNPPSDVPDEPKGDQPGKPEEVAAAKGELSIPASEQAPDSSRPEAPISDEPADRTSKGEPEDFEAIEIEPGEAQVRETLIEQILGSRYERQSFEATAHAPSMNGNDNTQNNNTQNIYGTAKRTVSFRTPPDVYDLPTCYEQTTQDRELSRLLERRTTVCLVGEPGTGRFTTACRALLDCPGIEQVKEVMPPPDQSVKDAVHDIDDVDPKHGYVLRIYGDDPGPIIGRLDGIVYARDSKLILIRDVTNRAPEQGDAELRHVPPSRSGVFRKHVHRLRKGAADTPERYISMLDRGLRLTGNPRAVVALVNEAVRHPADEANIERLNQRSRRGSRRVAAEILEVSAPDGPPGRRRLRQHRRAFRIAYAAMCDQPIHHVVTATGELLRALDAQSGWDDLGRTALEHSVEGLLGDSLKSTWHDEAGERCARLEDGMVEAILDVAWNEFDHTRDALIAWLNKLVEDICEVPRQAAITAAATLAVLDFDEAFWRLIDGWSKSPKPHVRRAAAQVVVILSLDHQLNRRVLRTVNDWVWGAANKRRDTAVWAYAGGLRQSDPRWILADLRRVAMDPMQKRTLTIAEAVGQLAEPALIGLIISTLHDWIRGDEPDRLVTRHAARAMLRIARIPVSGGWHNPPTLLAALSAGQFEVRSLGVLWHAALCGDSTWYQASRTLLEWLRRADKDPELRPPVTELLNEMANVSALRRRLKRLLVHPDAPQWIQTLTEEWNDD